LLQATSPLRRDGDIRNAIALYETGRFKLVMSVTKTDPGILKYGTVEDGCFTPISEPEYCFSNRQSLPSVSRPNGAIYVFSPEVFMRNASLKTSSIGAIEMPEACSIDIDSLADLEVAETMLSQSAIPLAS
jgi:N-acylneuraminate cytidylyltransferase